MTDVFFHRKTIQHLPKYREPTMQFGRAFDVVGLPATVILNTQGREVARWAGDTD